VRREQTCADADELFPGDVEYIRESLDRLPEQAVPSRTMRIDFSQSISQSEELAQRRLIDDNNVDIMTMITEPC